MSENQQWGGQGPGYGSARPWTPQHGPPQYGPPQYGPPQYAPPPQYGPAQYGPAQYGPPQYGPPPGYPAPRWDFRPTRYAPGAGVAVSALGLLALALSVFGLDWAKVDDSGFLDIAKGYRHVPDGVDLTAAQSITVAYFVWGAFTLLGLTAVLALLAGIPLPPTPTGNMAWRFLGALAAAIGFLGHIVALTQVFQHSETDPQFGAWVGLVGWGLLVIGLLLGARPTGPDVPPVQPLAAVGVVLAVLFPLGALVCGHIALAELKPRPNRPPRRGRGMAIASLVVGYLSVALMVAGIVVVLAADRRGV